jgi:hypothetical protein
VKPEAAVISEAPQGGGASSENDLKKKTEIQP